MKYVMFETVDGRKIPVIFPDVLTHAVVAKGMARVFDAHRFAAHPVSAGFTSLGLDVRTFGESESLDLKSKDSDAAYMLLADQAGFMSEALVVALLAELKERRDTE